MSGPLIVGLGGTSKTGSSSGRILHAALATCETLGCRTRMFDGPALDLPLFAAERPAPSGAIALMEALREADGIVIASPSYHGTVSGLVKNALDHVEMLAADERPYFEGRAVGLIAVAAGWQAAGSTLVTLRTIAHALRGWPTPIGIAANSAHPLFGEDGSLVEPALRGQLLLMAEQLVEFAGRPRSGELVPWPGKAAARAVRIGGLHGS